MRNCFNREAAISADGTGPFIWNTKELFSEQLDGQTERKRILEQSCNQNADELVLKLEHVSKEYRLGLVTGQTLKDALKERLHKDVNESNRFNPKFTALNDVSFTVGRGETVGLIGPNGAGKSTLLKLISRITAPTEGTIYIKGRVSSMLEVGTGFHQELTGRENIYLNGSILGMSRAEIEAKMDSIIEFSECQDFIDTPVKRYSSGMYVKLAFAVASHLESEIMIMDEVLAVGDEKFQRKCLNKMKEVAEKEHRTIIYVSHNMDTIYKLCKRCIVLDKGSLVFDGDVVEATRIYRGEALRTAKTMDLSQYLRPGWLGRDDVRLTWAEYVDYDADSDELCPRELRLCWTINHPVEQAGIRVELMDDNEKVFATQVFYNLLSGASGDTGEAHLNLNFSEVMNGTYQTFYTVFYLNDYGQGVDLDCVRGLDVSIRQKQKDIPMQWRPKSWGNIRLGGD